MNTPTFEFHRCDASKPAKAREFVDQILATRRFVRNVKSQILFEVSPGDFCLVDRRQNLQSILEDGAVMRLAGDLDESAHMAMWVWLSAAKWRLPRAGTVRA